MTVQLFVGLHSEGSTDFRFLESLVERTFWDVGKDCNLSIEIIINQIKINKSGLNFTEQVLEAARKGTNDFGISVLCVHTDSDDDNDTRAFDKINDAIQALKAQKDNSCQLITAVVPIQIIESWMLADKELLKSEIGTDKSNADLGISRSPESIANPKNLIENAIRIAREGLPKRRRKELVIGELYSSIGSKISIEKLNHLSSFQKFRTGVVTTFQKLNYM